MDLDNFLAGLKRQEHKHSSKPSRGNSRDTLFMISPREDGSMWVDCVDSKLRPVQADYHDMTGEAANAMRTIERIRERDTMRVEWGTEADDTDSVCINENPKLLYQLMRCNNLVLKDGSHVDVADESTHAVVQLNAKADGKKKTVLMPELSLAADNSMPSFLSDSYALSGHTIYPIASLGDNYTQLNVCSFRR